jgi:hypothetical protein
MRKMTMSRKGFVVVAGMACALALPATAGAAGTTTLPAGATQTTLAFCPGGAPGITDPGASAPSGCQGGADGSTVTLCSNADVHAFVKTEQMQGDKRLALAPLAGAVRVHLQSPDFGVNLTVDTFAGSGAALAQLGTVPPGSYEATGSLWAGSMTNADGTTTNYPGSSTSMTLVVTGSPCSTTTTTSTPTSNGSAKGGCGLGDKNHAHDPGDGKTCPTK